MKLPWKHTGPAREAAIEVPDISIGNYGYVLVHDPKRKCIVYVRAKDYGGELEASTWNGTAWTRQKGSGRINGDETHGFYDTARAGVAMWSVEHDYKVDRIVPNGVLVTDGKIQSIKTKGDHPVIEPDGDESFYLSSSRGCAMAFDAARGVTVCLTRRGVWELDRAGVWTKRGEPSKHVPPDWHDDARGTWDPVSERCVFWFQERGNGYKFWLAAWTGTEITKISMKGLPNPLADFFEPYLTFCGDPRRGVIAHLGGTKGTFALAKDAWTRVATTGEHPPRIGGASGCGMPHLACDPDRDAIMIGPGHHEGAPGGSDAQRVFYELWKGAWRRVGAVNLRSPIEAMSGTRRHVVVGDTWYATGWDSLWTMKWTPAGWVEVVGEKAAENSIGKDRIGAIAGTPEGLVCVSEKGAVFRLEHGKYKQLAKATPTFKTRSDFLLAHDGTRLVAWGGEIKNRKANDTLTFDGKKWTAVKKSSPPPKWRTKDVDFIEHTIVFDTKLARLVRFGYMEFAVLVGDEWKPYNVPAYTALIGSRKWQHVPAHDPVSGETLLVDFETGKISRWDLAKCELIGTFQYPAERKKAAEREHESVHGYFSEDAVFLPASRTLESQHAPDAFARHALDLGPAFAAAKKRPARKLLAIALLVALVACGSKSEPKRETPGSAAPADAAVVTPEKKPDPPDKPRPKPTKAQLDELRKRMKAGTALQKVKKWAEAVSEFEAALVAVPDAQRALAELGWSAMHAGDFVKARKADEAAIRVAVDKNVKASGLYNLGQVQEKTGDKAGAEKSFQESLKLRPHPVVEKALVALGAKPGVEPPFCAKGAKPCDCVLEHAFDENQRGTDATCAETKTPTMPVKTFKLYAISSRAYHGSSWTYVLDEANQLIDIVEGEAERGRLFEKTTLDKADVKTIGGRWVLWLETTSRSDVTAPSEDDAMITEEWTSRQVTICVIGDGKAPTRCPLRDVPLVQKTAKGKLDEAPTPATTTETHLDVTIADDGVATVKLVKGPSDAQIGKLVGPHKLW